MCDGGKCKCSDGFIRHNNACIGKVLTGFIVYCKKSFESDKYKSSMAEKSEAAVQRCFWEKLFWKNEADLQENTHAKV